MTQSKLTLDFFLHVFSILFLNPVLVSLVPISMFLSTALRTDSVHFQVAVLYAVSVWILKGLGTLNRRSRQKDKVKIPWTQQVIVVTGGASGLGSTLVSMLAMRRATVIVLDTQLPADPCDGVAYHVCDVSNDRHLAHTVAQLTHANDGLRPITTCISNAAVLFPGSILETPMSEIDLTLNINLRAQFLLAKAILPRMSSHGQWITIGSSLASVGVSCLGAYCASKAATVSFHESLTAELRGSRMATTLICPGQLDTSLFHGIRNPNAVLAPTLGVFQLAEFIVRKIETREAGEFAMPYYARWIGLMRVIPCGLHIMMRWISGIDEAAEALAQRRKTEKKRTVDTRTRDQDQLIQRKS